MNLQPLTGSEEFFEQVHNEAIKWRQEQRKKWLEEKIPLEDKYLIEKMEEMFPNDIWGTDE